MSKSTSFIVFSSLCIGIFSGLINSLLISGIPDVAFLDSFIGNRFAGFVFGVVTFPWFLWLLYRTSTTKRKWTVGLLWVMCSTASYFIAVIVGRYFSGIYMPGGVTYESDYFAFPAGFVGVLVVTIAFQLLFRKMHFLVWVLLLFLGTIIPPVILHQFHTTYNGGGGVKEWAVFLYPAWQGVITALLGYASTRNEPQKETAMLH